MEYDPNILSDKYMGSTVNGRFDSRAFLDTTLGSEQQSEDYRFERKLGLTDDMKDKDNYCDFMDSNPPLLDGDTQVLDIMKYLKVDGDGRPFTTEDGSARFNLEGERLLEANGAYSEPLDTFHEKGGIPVVKILLENGGEHIFNMFTGKIDLDPETKGTPNRASGPYKGTPESKMRKKLHAEYDVRSTWIPYGSGRDDKQGFFGILDRIGRTAAGGMSPRGSAYRNIEGETISTASELLYQMGTQGANN